MREPPADLSDDTLCASLRTHYRLAVVELTFLPLGHDSSAWVYRVRTIGDVLYFLKVRRCVSNIPGLLVPHYLHDHGIAQVVAPLPTVAQTLWAEAAGYGLILYPFITGTTGMAQGMMPRQWTDYGAILRQIHAATITPELARVMRRETFVPMGAAMIRELEAHIDSRAFDDPARRALGAFWRERRDEIATLAQRAEELGRRFGRSAPAFVLCHADIHTNNVMLDTGGRVWIVDWDETVLAPKERDLMFVVGGIIAGLVRPREQELFFQGYGAATINPLGLVYYRYAWAVSDIGEYGAAVFLRPDLSSSARRAAVDDFKRLFKPGNIVTIALASDSTTISPVTDPS